MPSLGPATLSVIRLLNRMRLDYYVTGSVATSIWGRPRHTHDVDFVATIPPESLEPLLEELGSEFYVSREAAKGALQHRTTFNAIHFKTMLKVDFWVPKGDPFSASCLRRRQAFAAEGETVWIISPEDLIVQKLLWGRETGSERHLRDAAGILAVRGDALDFDYINRWTQDLGLTHLLEKARAMSLED